tara:strand:- start:1621 stop:4215 length:2595 start_codon:yes stop_codon:yes gene_type:complete
MKSIEIRNRFIKFFQKKNHQIINSAPMVIKDDPTLMFTNAGMNQFKDLFLGNSEIQHSRVVNSQKCLRVSGKHNDLEEVGHDTYHHTMFEMLGNWSFGDYFKKEAIEFAWEFLTKECNLEKDRLYVTIFEGDKTDNIEKDVESYNFWKNHLPETRILNGNKKYNFWEMGEIGPCGPCSEIHYDNRDETERNKVDGSSLVNMDHPQVIEIWNLVFMQYNRKSDNSLELLPNKHVDTGMGLERLCMIVQNVKSNYDTDVFTPLISKIENISGLRYGKNEKIDIAMRVVSDHIRAISFSIADGQLPSNVKAGYVIRRILRRAVRYSYTFLGIKDPFMYRLVEVICKNMGDSFPELHSQEDLITKVINEEEKSFLRTLSEGLRRLDVIMKSSDKMVSGELVFELYDTYGFPLDLTSLILSENNFQIDVETFHLEMEQQKNRSRQATKIETSDWNILFEDEKQEFIGYDTLETDIKISRFREVKTKEGNLFHLVFNLTPFYPEGGGQIGDVGSLTSKMECVEIIDTKKENNLIIHITEKLPEFINEEFIAKVNVQKRKSSSRNHTATHLLHETLREVLGNHVEQKGSLVCPDYLRFDFTHFSKLSEEELNNIETKVNLKIKDNIPLQEHKNLPIKNAKNMGAIMLFGEKYADTVRAIQYASSIELCGGTHVSTTAEILSFKITSESSAAAGIRRIEAITADAVTNHYSNIEEDFQQIKSLVKNKDVVKGVSDLVLANKDLSRKIESYKSLEANMLISELLDKKKVINTVDVIAEKVSVDASVMKDISFKFKKSESNLLMMLVSENNSKVVITIMITDDLVEKGRHAGTLIREVSSEVNGGGGGQPFFATAGGSDPSGIPSAIKKFKQLI